jgi:hypothetical protein
MVGPPCNAWRARRVLFVLDGEHVSFGWTLAELCGGWNWTNKMQIGAMNEELMWDVLVCNTNVGRENEN